MGMDGIIMVNVYNKKRNQNGRSPGRHWYLSGSGVNKEEWEDMVHEHHGALGANG